MYRLGKEIAGADGSTTLTFTATDAGDYVVDVLPKRNVSNNGVRSDDKTCVSVSLQAGT